MIILSCIAEIITAILILISPISINKTPVIIFLVMMIIVKLICNAKFNCKESVFTMFFVSIFYYIGLILKVSMQISLSSIRKEFIMGIVGIIVGCIICKRIYSRKPSSILKKCFNATDAINLKHGFFKTFAQSLRCLAPFLIPLIFIIISYKLFRSGSNDGSIQISGISFQLPEAIKILLILYVYLIDKSMDKCSGNIIFIYVSSLIACASLMYVGEIGTILITFYFMIAITLFFSITKNQNSLFPCLLTAAFFFGIALIKKLTYEMFPLRGALGEAEYGLNNKWFNISSRLWGDSAQVTSAREILQSSPFIQLNLSFTMNIPNCDLPTAISDYCLVMLTQVFGKVIGFVIPLVMIVLLIIAFTKCDCLGKCASLMMLMQIVVQISGILGFCFTGINLPIISSGASSMFSSLVLTTFISFSMSHNKKEEIKRKNL